MSPTNRKIYTALFILLGISLLLRAFVAGFIELGNDEVYYLNYAKYPALSHFDHPPMVGLVIQFFTLNLMLTSEFFIRLAAIILGTLSTALMFLIGREIKNSLTGLYAALLFTASLYGFILSGTFILPDAPEVFFWLLTLYLLLKTLPDREYSTGSRRLLLLAGLFAGLAILSKYHSVFLITGMFGFILFHRRRWLTIRETWGALLLFILLCMPVVLWNIGNDFISFTYHEDRVAVTGAGFRPQYFLTEIAGQFFYNNPVNFILVLCAVVALLRGRRFLKPDSLRILLWASVPLFLVFTSFSLFRSTLPHWTGPAYLGFIQLAAAWLSEPKSEKRIGLVPWPLAVSLGFMLFVVVGGATQIHYGWIRISGSHTKDITTDMTGWRQLGEKFSVAGKKYEQQGLMKKGAPILTFRWFPAANFDYYIGDQTGNPVYALGTLERIHKYHWINHERGSLPRGTNAWFINLSDDYGDPVSLYGSKFDTIIPADTICVLRRTDTIRKVYLYRLVGLKEEMKFPL